MISPLYMVAFHSFFIVVFHFFTLIFVVLSLHFFRFGFFLFSLWFYILLIRFVNFSLRVLGFLFSVDISFLSRRFFFLRVVFRPYYKAQIYRLFTSFFSFFEFAKLSMHCYSIGGCYASVVKRKNEISN